MLNADKFDVRAPMAALSPRCGAAVVESDDAAELRVLAADYMGTLQLEFFQRRLLALQSRLMAQVELARVDFATSEVNADPMDRASSEEARIATMRAHAREADMLIDVRKALARISAGDFGWCEETGEQIGFDRLLAQPTARLSFEAQQAREKKARYHAN